MLKRDHVIVGSIFYQVNHYTDEVDTWIVTDIDNLNRVHFENPDDNTKTYSHPLAFLVKYQDKMNFYDNIEHAQLHVKAIKDGFLIPF